MHTDALWQQPPSLHDGVLCYKRKWDVTICEPRDNCFDLLLHWNRLDDAVANFLSHTSLIIRDHGGFCAIHALKISQPATEVDVLQAHNALWMRGLQRLYLFNAASWVPGVAAPPEVVLLDPSSAGQLRAFGIGHGGT